MAYLAKASVLVCAVVGDDDWLVRVKRAEHVGPFRRGHPAHVAQGSSVQHRVVVGRKPPACATATGKTESKKRRGKEGEPPTRECVAGWGLTFFFFFSFFLI